MADDHIQALDLRLFERLDEGSELKLPPDQQSPLPKCTGAPAGKNTITGDIAVLRIFKIAAQDLADERRERRVQARPGNPEVHGGGAISVQTDLHFRGSSSLGGLLLAGGGTSEDRRQAKPD